MPTALEWLPLRGIRGGLALLDRGAARALEVSGINLHLRSRAERRRLARAEEALWNGLRFPVQRLTLPAPIDLRDYLNELESQADAVEPEAPGRAEALRDKAEHLRSLVATQHLVEWRHLLVLPWDGAPQAPERDARLQERVQQVRQGLERMGLAPREVDVAAWYAAWDAVLHPGRQAPEALVYSATTPGALLALLPYGGFDFRPARHFVMDGRCCRVLMVTGYPRRAGQGALAELFQIDRRVIVSQHLHPTDSGALQRSLSNSIGEIRARFSLAPSPHEQEELRVRLRDAQRLLRKLATANHAVLDLCTYLLLVAGDVAELDALTRLVQARLTGMGMRSRALMLTEQQDGLRAVLPMGHNPLRALCRQNLPAEAMPASFPYVQGDLSHGRGALFGLNRATGNLCLLDPWALTNPHVAYIGMSGSGKTFAMNEAVMQFWAQGIPIRSVDIEGDKGRLCRDLGGQRIRLAPRAGNIINPMEVRPGALDPSGLDGESEEPANGLAAAIQRQLILFGLMLPDAGAVELARAEQHLIACYEARGIGFGTDFTALSRHAWPTWRDLYPLLAADPDTRRLAAVMQAWVAGSLQGMLDGPTTVELDNPYVLLDLHDVMGHRLARAPVFFLAVTYLWDEINRDWSRRKVLDIDELGILADSEDALEFVWRVSKCARRRRCRLQVATQDPADFLSGRNDACRKYAAGILNNCAMKILGYLEPDALRLVAQAVHLSEAEQELIARLPVTDKLLIAGEHRAHVQVVASPRQLRTLDTGRA